MHLVASCSSGSKWAPVCWYSSSNKILEFYLFNLLPGLKLEKQINRLKTNKTKTKTPKKMKKNRTKTVHHGLYSTPVQTLFSIRALSTHRGWQVQLTAVQNWGQVTHRVKALSHIQSCEISSGNAFPCLHLPSCSQSTRGSRKDCTK